MTLSSNKILNVAKLGTVDYQVGLDFQEAIVVARTRDQIGDTLLLLEHPHVYTLGRGADERFILNPPAGVDIRRVARGGQVTYHGPGQLVGYPILKLTGAARDVHRYLRTLEDAMIAALARYGIVAGRRERFTGVWVGPRKIGSIGVGIRRWVTLHGFALNVSPDLSFFDAIVPCGIEGCMMTSIAAEGHPKVSLTGFADTMAASFAEVFGYCEVADASAVGDLATVERAQAAREVLR